MFRKAQKSLSKARICLAGPAGSGKTYSALLLASGLGKKIAMIDTEHGSGDLYADQFVYDIQPISAPFECQKYLDAIHDAEKQGYEVIIIDSLSHAWAGEGGLLDFHSKVASGGKDNSYTAWRHVTPLHNGLIEAMLQSKCHIIATARAKTEYAIDKDASGKTVIRKIGMQPIFRDGIEFEFTVFFDLSQEHTAMATKDRTSLFDGKYFKIRLETGRQIMQWLNSNNHKTDTADSDKAPEPSGDMRELSRFIDQTFQGAERPQGISPQGNGDAKTTQKRATKPNFLESIERLKANIDPEIFKQICKEYEPVHNLHDRTRQIELYNKLKEASVVAVA